MPRIDGFEMLEQMLAINPEIKLILFSGVCTDDRARWAKEKGAADFIHKPFDLKQLTSSIERVLSNAVHSDSVESSEWTASGRGTKQKKAVLQ